MEGSKLDGYLSRGEGLSLEFKRCGNQPGADTFETICSFANRQGAVSYTHLRSTSRLVGSSWLFLLG